MKRFLRITAISVAMLVALLAGTFWMLFGGLQAQSAGLALGAGAEPVYDGFSTVFMLDAGNGQVALIDAGNDTAGTAILDALGKRNASADNVAAIFITHAHPDHDAAIAVFPRATVYAMQAEVPVAEAKEPYGSVFSWVTGRFNPHPFQVTHPLEDGEKVTVGNLEVTAFALPGHTPGSGAYLAQGVLYLGDAAMINSGQQVIGPSKAFSNDTEQGLASLKRLAEELQPRAEEVKVLATAHTGGVAGLGPLAALGGPGPAPAAAAAPAPAAAPQPPATNTVAPDIPGVVAGGTTVEVIKEGFDGTEGPIGMPDGSLIFTETAANRITRIDRDGNTSTFLENTNGSNGLAFDSRGRLVSVQTVPGQMRVGVIYPQGSETVLAENYEGTAFARPNDLVVDKEGGVYFTDAGLNPNQNPPPPPMPLAVYYITPAGSTLRVAEGIERPNGVQLSPDERTLYVNNSDGEYLLAFDIQADGTLRNRRNFARYEGVIRAGERLTSGADGLAIDAQGRVYACTQVGIQVFNAQGQPLGIIPLSRGPQNLAFAGPDKKTLYIVGRGAAFKVQMLAQGYMGRAK